MLSRYFGIDLPINSSKGIKEFKKLAQELIDKKRPADFNQAIMEFGAIQCTPKNPDCNDCPFMDKCIAFNNNRIGDLPVKIKARKVKKKYFNFLVFISEDGKTILEKREGKGIWQSLYQFPLVETNKNVDIESFSETIKSHTLFKHIIFDLLLYNEEPVIHKLSHQHLYTKFWIVNTPSLNIKRAIELDKIRNFPVPILIGNFIENFNFE